MGSAVGSPADFVYEGDVMRWLWLLLVIVVALLSVCIYRKQADPLADARPATPEQTPAPGSPGSPSSPASPGSPANASPSPAMGGPDSAPAGADPETELPIDPSQPMPERSLSTDGALERDKPARFMVDGRSDIYSAGLAKTDPERHGVLPTKIDLAAGGGTIRFQRVAGKAGCVQDAAYGPDGGDCAGGDTNLEPAGGISGIVAHERSLFLVGVFLATSAPETPPPALDFSTAARGVAFAELAPALGQVFFIGDGRTGTGEGEVQRFVIPATATRLFLGYADGGGFQGAPGWYGDNTGGVNATLVQRAE